MATHIDAVSRDGFTIVPGVFSAAECVALAQELEHALGVPSAATSIRSQQGSVYAARNILDLWPHARSVWRRPPLPALLTQLLGPRHGLVRGLFFDKPPEQTWALPWHKDLTIAVRAHQPQLGAFRTPTTKAGIPHVEASEAVLQQMLTVRIHLDAVTEANGPMRVLPGSHHTGKTLVLAEEQRRSVLCAQGDVLLIRPLVAHSSAASHPENRCHRRTIHLEFAGQAELPDGYQWHTFVPS